MHVKESESNWKSTCLRCYAAKKVWSATTNKNRQLEYARTHAHANAPVVAELVALETVVRPSGHTLVYGRDCKHQHTFSRL